MAEGKDTLAQSNAATPPTGTFEDVRHTCARRDPLEKGP